MAKNNRHGQIQLALGRALWGMVLRDQPVLDCLGVTFERLDDDRLRLTWDDGHFLLDLA